MDSLLLAVLPTFLANDPLGLFLLVSLIAIVTGWTILLIASLILP
jgi:hypothetical protein